MLALFFDLAIEENNFTMREREREIERKREKGEKRKFTHTAMLMAIRVVSV